MSYNQLQFSVIPRSIYDLDWVFEVFQIWWNFATPNAHVLEHFFSSFVKSKHLFNFSFSLIIILSFSSFTHQR